MVLSVTRYENENKKNLLFLLIISLIKFGTEISSLLLLCFICGVKSIKYVACLYQLFTGLGPLGYFIRLSKFPISIYNDVIPA